MTVLGFRDSVSISSDDEKAESDRRLVYKHKFGIVELHRQSLDCLKTGSYLSDNIIQFYSAFLLNEASDAQAKRFHIFDTIFFEQLTKTFYLLPPDYKIDVPKCRQLSKWYNGVDLFKKDFLIIPCCLDDHWFSIVICYPNNVEPAFRKSNSFSQVEIQNSDEDEVFEDSVEDLSALDGQPETSSTKKTPCIIIMDSLNIKNRTISMRVRDFLDFEWRTKCSIVKKFSHHDLKDYFPSLPKQKNTYDCGIFMLLYLRCFMENPDKFYNLVITSDAASRIELKNMIRSVNGNDRDSMKKLIIRVCKPED